MTNTPPLLELRGIDKRFGEVHANRAVDLTLAQHEVLGLLGENGAGKTTLMNILFGIYRADAGRIIIDGQDVVIRGPADALIHGIGMVHQHFHLVASFSVLDNLLIGQKGRFGRLDRASARERLASIGERYGLHLEPGRLVSSLTVGEQQRLEIVKALFRGARVLVLDEPTSVLTPGETEGLFAALRAMVEGGVGIIFISHKLDEVRAITDRLMVMRQGAVAATLANDEHATNHRLAALMCGHDLTPPVKEAGEAGPVLLQLDGITTKRAPGRPVGLDHVTLSLHGGEILGIAGVSGNGQRELAELVGGMLAPATGQITVAGQEVTRATPRTMQGRGVASIPEDRIGTGLLSTLPLTDSMVLPRVHGPPFSRFGILQPGAIRDFVRREIEKFGIRAAGPEVRTGTLSGGNLQKALLARELAFEPSILVAAQPTRGLDIAAQEFVHRQFLELRARGAGVLLISEDLEELFALSDRIAVLFEGRIMAVVPTSEADLTRIGLLMAGIADAA